MLISFHFEAPFDQQAAVQKPGRLLLSQIHRNKITRKWVLPLNWENISLYIQISTIEVVRPSSPRTEQYQWTMIKIIPCSASTRMSQIEGNEYQMWDKLHGYQRQIGLINVMLATLLDDRAVGILSNMNCSLRRCQSGMFRLRWLIWWLHDKPPYHNHPTEVCLPQYEFMLFIRSRYRIL
jgi:hypothetical protein